MTRRRPIQAPAGALLAIVLGALAVAALPSRAEACSCGRLLEPAEVVGAADVVVVATVGTEDPVPARHDEDGATYFDPGWYDAVVGATIERVVADDAPSTVRPDLRITIARSRGCGFGVDAAGAAPSSAPRVLPLQRIGGHLVQMACYRHIDVDAVGDLSLDLPPTPSAGSVEMVTVGTLAGPSDVQLRDRRGEVVAWGALPLHAESAPVVCAGARAAIAHRWDPTAAGRLTSIVDLATFAVHPVTASLPEGSIAACAGPDADLVVVGRSGDEREHPERLLVDTASGATIAPLAPGVPAALLAGSDGRLLAWDERSLVALDVADGTPEPVASVPEPWVAHGAATAPDGGAVLLLTSVAAMRHGYPPTHAVLLVEPDGSSSVVRIEGGPAWGEASVLPDGTLVFLDGQLNAQHVGRDGRVLATLPVADAGASPAQRAAAIEPQYDAWLAGRSAWLAVGDGELWWGEPGDADVVVPVDQGGHLGTFVAPHAVDPEVAAIHTRVGLRARILPDEWPPPLVDVPREDRTERLGPIALGAIAAALAVAAVTGRRRHRARR